MKTMGEIFKVTSVRDHIWRIQERSVYAFLIEGEEKAMLIDAGFNKDTDENNNIRKLAESLTSKPLILVNTHSDGDHSCGNVWFAETMMHPCEFARYWDKNKLEFDYEGYKCPPTPIWEGDVIDLGNFKFEVILTPGHTMGSICLLEREKRFMFTGDTVQGNGHIHLWGNGRNPYAYKASLEKLKQYEPLVDVLYPSHDKQELSPDYISRLAEDIRMILDGEVKGTTPDPKCYPFPIKADLFAFPEANLYVKINTKQ